MYLIYRELRVKAEEKAVVQVGKPLIWDERERGREGGREGGKESL